MGRAWQVYICEPHGFLAKLAYAGVQRHTLITFERENWPKLPMNVALSERVRQAGSIAFRAGQFERAIALYTEALPPTDRVPELKVNLLANRALCYLKLGEPESALADATASVRTLPEFGKGYYRMAQALVELGRISEARKRLEEVLRISKHGKNADASKLLEELVGREDVPRAPKQASEERGKGAAAARRALIREDRAQRLSVEEVNSALISRCEHFSVLHRPYDGLRMHHELHAKPDLVLCHNIDYSLLGQGLVLAINNLKKEECLRPDAQILPAAARVWAMGVQVLTDTGVPIDMQPMEELFWSPIARKSACARAERQAPSAERRAPSAERQAPSAKRCPWALPLGAAPGRYAPRRCPPALRPPALRPPAPCAALPRPSRAPPAT